MLSISVILHSNSVIEIFWFVVEEVKINEVILCSLSKSYLNTKLIDCLVDGFAIIFPSTVDNGFTTIFSSEGKANTSVSIKRETL